jgi:hypothetical protein
MFCNEKLKLQNSLFSDFFEDIALKPHQTSGLCLCELLTMPSFFALARRESKTTFDHFPNSY